MRHDAADRTAGPRRCALAAVVRRRAAAAAPPRADLGRPVLVLPRVPPGTRLLLGRSRTADVRFLEPTVSRHHATLSRVENGWLIADHGSAHGTFVNGRRAPLAVLHDGDELRLGLATAMVVRI
jgi:hypothetical protein